MATPVEIATAVVAYLKTDAAVPTALRTLLTSDATSAAAIETEVEAVVTAERSVQGQALVDQQGSYAQFARRRRNVYLALANAVTGMAQADVDQARQLGVAHVANRIGQGDV